MAFHGQMWADPADCGAAWPFVHIASPPEDNSTIATPSPCFLGLDLLSSAQDEDTDDGGCRWMPSGTGVGEGIGTKIPLRAGTIFGAELLPGKHPRQAPAVVRPPFAPKAPTPMPGHKGALTSDS